VTIDLAVGDLPALQRRALGLGTLVEVSGALAATLDLERILQATTDGVCRLAGFDTAAVYLLDGETLHIRATTPPLPPTFPATLRDASLGEHPHIARALETRRPVAIRDARIAELTAAERIAADQRGLRAVLYCPMIAGVKPVGVVIVSDTTRPLPLTPDEIDLCRTLANLAALATENARLYEAGVEHAAALARQAEDARRADAERLELERRLLHAQKLESMGILAGGIAHDFNNLLQAMLGTLDVALPELAQGSAARDAVEQAVHAARRAADLTRQLLAYSGKGRFVVRPVDVTALVRENAHLLRASVPHTCAIDLRLADDVPAVVGDVAQLQQVVMNLITNAADAIGAAPGLITLTTALRPGGAGALAGSRIIDATPADAYVSLEVADTGCGMDADTLARIFDPFFSTKGAGRGLGMSALLGIVRGHGGALFVDSAPGRGTTVRVLLPARRDAVATPEVAAPRAHPPALPRGGAVLVVDDEQQVRRACEAMVRALGLSVFAAGGGEEALALLRAHRGEIRYAVVDLSMPGMNGLAALEALLEVDPALRVVLSSGFDEHALAERDPRIAGFIQKPYSVAELRSALAQAGAG
jgi:signal transduction histidine kinase/CheY-like chemotaxis protein